MTTLEELAYVGRFWWRTMIRMLENGHGDLAMEANNNWNEINIRIREHEYND